MNQFSECQSVSTGELSATVERLSAERRHIPWGIFCTDKITISRMYPGETWHVAANFEKLCDISDTLS